MECNGFGCGEDSELWQNVRRLNANHPSYPSPRAGVCVTSTKLIFYTGLGAHFVSIINSTQVFATSAQASTQASTLASALPLLRHLTFAEHNSTSDVTLILSNLVSVKWLLMHHHFIKANCFVASLLLSFNGFDGSKSVSCGTHRV